MPTQWCGVISQKNGVMFYIAAKKSELPHRLSIAKTRQVMIVKKTITIFFSRILQKNTICEQGAG
jgi:hypothetical protein